MKKYIGQVVRVRDNENNKWQERELLAVLPDDVEFRYIVRHISDWSTYIFCEPIPKKKVTQRRWKMLCEINGYTATSSSYVGQKNIDEDWKNWYKHPTDFIDVEVEDV